MRPSVQLRYKAHAYFKTSLMVRSELTVSSYHGNELLSVLTRMKKKICSGLRTSEQSFLLQCIVI
jgi:hypothetical protein